MFHSVTSILLLPLLISNSVPMKVSFCDGGKLVTLEDSQCPGGVNFGSRKPDCVCISGIYRLWMDNCVVYDGFMHEGCATLKQGQFDVVGMRLTGRVKHFSNVTSAVFAEKDADYKTWNAYSIGKKGKSTSDNFYTVHGDPYIFTRASGAKLKKFSICVEKKIKRKDEICRYYQEDDEIWSEEEGKYEIRVEEKCEESFGSKRIPLKAQSCYSIMKQSDSECSLSCKKSKRKEIINIDPESNSLEDLSSNSIVRRSSDPKAKNASNKASNKTTGSSVSASTNKLPPFKFFSNDSDVLSGGIGVILQAAQGDLHLLSADPIEFANINEGNITSVSITQQMDENNFFLNRKLNHYSKLRQVGYIKPNDLRQIAPTRTFELLDIIKDIGKKACPEQYVSSLFIDQAVDLFVILHKGRNYRYTEDLGKGDFEWIKTILAGCLIDTREIFLSQEEHENSDKCMDFQNVKGVCQSPGENCTDLTISESHQSLGKYHFVVEAAWDLIDLAQIVCFPSFAQSYRMFHQWEQASEKLFTREIRKLWHNPNLSMKVYQNLLTPSAQIDMFNLEMCVEGAYATNPVLTRLSRPPEPRRFFRRKKREAGGGGGRDKRLDVYCRKTEPDFEYPC